MSLLLLLRNREEGTAPPVTEPPGTGQRRDKGGRSKQRRHGHLTLSTTTRLTAAGLVSFDVQAEDNDFLELFL